MVDVSAELGQLSELDELTGPAAAAVLDASGWVGEHPVQLVVVLRGYSPAEAEEKGEWL